MENGRNTITETLISNLKVKKQAVGEKILGKEDESKRLLSPRNDEISSKSKRKVQWNDTNGGHKLAEIVEYLPSDMSDDSDDDDDSDSDSCFCTIM